MHNTVFAAERGQSVEQKVRKTAYYIGASGSKPGDFMWDLW
jgi:hypothetical protein